MASHFLPHFITVTIILGICLVLYTIWIVLWSKAVSFIFTNNEYCSENLCLYTTGFDPLGDYRLPQSMEEYSPKTGLYCLSLIQYVYDAQHDEMLKLPRGFKRYASLQNRLDKNRNIGYILGQGNVLWVIFRGTLTMSDIENDIVVRQVSFGSDGVMVNKGAFDIYSSFRSKLLSFIDYLTFSTVIITGHSLGGSLATLAMYDICKKFSTSKQIIVYTYASPRVGNIQFTAELKSMRNVCYRVVNTADIFPQVPLPIAFRPWRPTRPVYYDHYGKVYSFTDNKKNYTYNHSIGTYITHLNNVVNDLSTGTRQSIFDNKLEY